jgi:hypothetical protein
MGRCSSVAIEIKPIHVKDEPDGPTCIGALSRSDLMPANALCIFLTSNFRLASAA